jgi:transposase
VRDNDGRKLDHKTLETLRIRAVEQIERGARVEEVAETLGLARSTVFGWVAKYREGGRNALAARPVPGRPPKLSGAQLAKIYDLIVGRDPRQLSFEFALWTRGMVRELIRREFGVGLSEVSVGRLLRKLGLSPQRPLWRAYQQDPEAVERWKREQFPAIRDEAARDGATIWFADEAGVRSDYHAGTTWAPVGHTPIVRTTGARHSVNLVSAVTAQGALRFAAYAGKFTSATFIDFCKRLLHDSDRPVFLVVDGHPTHRSRAVQEFVLSTKGKLRLFHLPGYSPELNPDEWVWKNVKTDRVGRAGVTGPEDLKAKALSALHRLQKLPSLIRGFFADPNLSYITAC